VALSGRSISGLASTLALLFAGAAPLACFKPTIVDGGLRCKADAGARSCPEGFQCDPVLQTCWRSLDGGRDGHADRSDGMDAAVDTPDGDAADGPICFESKVGCAPQSGVCDPICQTGCGCREKCSVNTAGALTCNEPLAGDFPRTLMQMCAIGSEGTAIQTDNCAPGLVCAQDQDCFARCFQFCESDNDCTNASCTREVGSRQGGGVVRKVCDIPFVDTCVPLPSSQNTGCPGTNTACYLSSASPTHTICDCPFGAGGSGAPCTRTRECVRGLVCADSGNGAPACRQVCRLSMNGQDCLPVPMVGACRPYTGVPPGAVAHPTFGYCMP
jgi:hypothetical protein